MSLYDWFRRQTEVKIVGAVEGIETSNVQRFWWKHEQNEWDFRDDYPNIAPPFRSYFMWGNQGTRACIEGRRVERPMPADGALGMLFGAVKIAEGWSITARLCGGTPGRERWQPVAFCYRVSGEGRFMSATDEAEQRHRGVGIIIPEEYRSDPDILDEASTMLHPFLLATSFLHCKNVSLRPVAFNEKQQRSQQKRGRPRFSYHVLEVGPMVRTLETEGGLGTETLKRALHICRGHFKDYRDGGGLFGRHRGLYWWDQSLRGDPDSGVVEKTYRVRA